MLNNFKCIKDYFVNFLLHFYLYDHWEVFYKIFLISYPFTCSIHSYTLNTLNTVNFHEYFRDTITKYSPACQRQCKYFPQPNLEPEISNSYPIKTSIKFLNPLPSHDLYAGEETTNYK